jgi:N-acetylmuramoyl-L-alanine amidase
VRPYVVRTGDHLPALAHRLGFDADAVWNHPKNADLKKLRGSPNILCTGDVLYVPEPAPAAWISVPVGSTTRFTATVPRIALNLAFAIGGKAIANADCIVHGMPPPNRFTTDGDGKLALKVPVITQALTVEFPKVPLIRRVKIGHLDPISEPSGLVQRLRTLGYFSPRTAVAPSDTEAIARAVSQFQKDQDLPVTGEVDDATRDALGKAHGC